MASVIWWESKIEYRDRLLFSLSSASFYPDDVACSKLIKITYYRIPIEKEK